MIGVIVVMPLAFAKTNEDVTIAKIKGKDDLVCHLENLGFIKDAKISVVSESGGNLIVRVHDGRIAISKSMANKIFVSEGMNGNIR